MYLSMYVYFPERGARARPRRRTRQPAGHWQRAEHSTTPSLVVTEYRFFFSLPLRLLLLELVDCLFHRCGPVDQYVCLAEGVDDGVYGRES